MSNDKAAARALSRCSRESLHFLGSSDGPALANFLEDYFCGDDPANESPGNIIANTNISADTLPNANKTRIDELDEDDHMDIQGNTKLIEA